MIDITRCAYVHLDSGVQCEQKAGHVDEHRHGELAWQRSCPTCSGTGYVSKMLTTAPPKVAVNLCPDCRQQRPAKPEFPPEIVRAMDIITDVNAYFRQQNRELREAFLLLHAAADAVADFTSGPAEMISLQRALELTAPLASDVKGRFGS